LWLFVLKCGATRGRHESRIGIWWLGTLSWRNNVHASCKHCVRWILWIRSIVKFSLFFLRLSCLVTYYAIIFIFYESLCFTDISEPRMTIFERWCIIKERDFRPRHTDNSDEVSEESQTSNKFHCTSATMDTKVCLYNESYLSMGFRWISGSSCSIPLCLICGRWLIIAAMVPAKLKQHLTINHSHVTSKIADCFRRLLES
jgi:hypothetical protein